MSARTAVLMGVGLAAVLALAGCTPGTVGPVAGRQQQPERLGRLDRQPTPSVSAAPAAPTFKLPANCTAIASAATLNTVFSGVPSRPPGDLTRPAPSSASKKLDLLVVHR